MTLLKSQQLRLATVVALFVCYGGILNAKSFTITGKIVDDDGTMARQKSLLKISKEHNIKIISIADLIAYRKKFDKLIEQISTVPFPTDFGKFELRLFEDKINGDHHVAVIKGEINKDDNVLVRVHSQCLTGDIFGS